LYSGAGSYGSVAEQYISTIVDFIQRNEIKSVVDVGCGDFSIGSRLVPHVERYVGLDVSSVVIHHNAARFANERIRFIECDATRDQLPSGELCLIRQVLQHLSNDDIQSIVSRTVMTYRFVIVTEHYPATKAFKAFNVDKRAGCGIRVVNGSAVYLGHPPYKFEVGQTLLDIPLGDDQWHFTTRDDNPESWETMKTFLVGRGSGE
jgi:SAM-dependent methyltransferase